MIFVGDDWAEDHHDVYVCDAAGTRLARRRLGEGVDGIAAFHALVAEHADNPAGVAVGIETDRGLWVTALVDAGYQVFGVNPRAAARYRERHSMSGAKSDRGDARMLAEEFGGGTWLWGGLWLILSIAICVDAVRLSVRRKPVKSA